MTHYRARMDYLDGLGITEKHFVRFEGLEFNIVSVLIDFATRKTIDLQLVEQTRGA